LLVFLYILNMFLEHNNKHLTYQPLSYWMLLLIKTTKNSKMTRQIKQSSTGSHRIRVQYTLQVHIINLSSTIYIHSDHMYTLDSTQVCYTKTQHKPVITLIILICSYFYLFLYHISKHEERTKNSICRPIDQYTIFSLLWNKTT
jgi:hypothetical protein